VLRLAIVKTILKRKREEEEEGKGRRSRRKEEEKDKRRRRAAAASLSRIRCNKHWPAKSSTQLPAAVCSSRGQRKGIVYQCVRCDISLCVVPCFAEYNTK